VLLAGANGNKEGGQAAEAGGDTSCSDAESVTGRPASL